MISLFFTILFLVQPVFPSTDNFTADTLDSDIQILLDFNKESKKLFTKVEKANFFNEVSYSLYDKTLNLEENTKEILIQYSALINNLEQRLSIDQTLISYSLGSPSIKSHYKQIQIDRKNLKNKLHFNQAELMRDQYLELSRYHHKIINICEDRVDELLSLLDENSLSRLFGETVLDKNIIVMNFNNLSNNEKYDNLISIFPEMIINRYKNRDDVTVTYSGSIEPDLRKVIKSDSSKSARFLIDGSYSIDGYEIKVNFKIYDINDWSLKTNQNLTCDVRDVDCVYDSFLWNIKKSVDPLVEFEHYDDFSEDANKIINRIDLDSIDINKRGENLFKPLLEDFAVQKDYSFDINYKDMDMGESQSIKTQAFDLSNYPNGIQTRKELLEDFTNRLDKFLVNPYEISIGELVMNVNETDNSYVDLIVPISYSFNRKDFEKLIKKMPYNTLKSKKESYTLEFLNDNYLFEDQSINQFNKHENELFPVLFFANNEGNIQKIIIDSWDFKYDNLLFGDYDVNRIDKFVQLFSIIAAGDNMHFNINKKDMTILYEAAMAVSVLDNYTQLTVKIFTRRDLDAYLQINELKF